MRETDSEGNLTRVFRGPNGWYVATEDRSGTHYQPADGGTYSTAAEAWAAYQQPREEWSALDL